MALLGMHAMAMSHRPRLPPRLLPGRLEPLLTRLLFPQRGLLVRQARRRPSSRCVRLMMTLD